MKRTAFLRPKLVGQRFANHTIPLEVLKDLSVLEEFVVEVAKAKFLEANPKRERSPRGFARGISLHLTGIESGSAVAIIELEEPNEELYGNRYREYFDQARDSIARAIDAASRNEQVVPTLPERTLMYFDKLGRSLREDEAIEFDYPGSDAPARLDKETRRALLLALPQIDEFTEERLLRGLVPEADQDDDSCHLLLTTGEKIKAPLVNPHRDTLLRAFNGYSSGLKVAIDGICRIDRRLRVVQVDAVNHVALLEPLDVAARMGELSQLQDGWLDGQGSAPSRSGLRWFEDHFLTQFPDDLPLPRVYPTPEGDLQAEWCTKAVEASLLVHLDTHAGYWHQVTIDSGIEESRDLNFDTPDGWRVLGELVRALTEDEQ